MPKKGTLRSTREHLQVKTTGLNPCVRVNITGVSADRHAGRSRQSWRAKAGGLVCRGGASLCWGAGPAGTVSGVCNPGPGEPALMSSTRYRCPVAPARGPCPPGHGCLKEPGHQPHRIFHDRDTSIASTTRALARRPKRAIKLLTQAPHLDLPILWKPRAVQHDTAHRVAIIFATGGPIANTHAGAKCSTDGNFVQRDSNTTRDGSTYPDFDQQFRVKIA